MTNCGAAGAGSVTTMCSRILSGSLKASGSAGRENGTVTKGVLSGGAPGHRGSRTPTELNGFRVFDGASLAHPTTEASAAAILHPGELATGTPKFDDG
jgi:hypothetical protein